MGAKSLKQGAVWGHDKAHGQLAEESQPDSFGRGLCRQLPSNRGQEIRLASRRSPAVRLESA